MDKTKLARFGMDYKNGEPFDGRPWKWFGTLSFAGRPSEDTVNRVRRNWFRELHRVEGRPDSLDYVYITECGQFAGRVRFHILMNSEQIGFKWDWMRCWIEFGGEDAILYYYRPGFFRYALQSADEDSDLDIIMSDGGLTFDFSMFLRRENWRKNRVVRRTRWISE